jgi:group I intron endonuclease
MYYVGVHATETPYEFDGYLGSGVAIKGAIKKYGKENFIRRTLLICDTSEYAYDIEQKLVSTEFVKERDNYNICSGGLGAGSGESHVNYGKPRTEEVKKKISDSKSGEKHPLYGKHLSEETKQKLSVACTGWRHTEETKERLSAAKSGENHPFLGSIYQQSIN